jgi:hypothetical protein
MIFPGNANLLIGAAKTANQEIGVPGFNPLKVRSRQTHTIKTAVFWFVEEISLGATCFPSPLGQFSLGH